MVQNKKFLSMGMGALNVTGPSIILRVKNVNSDFSQDYKDVIGVIDRPVVLSMGIHSNLFSWQDFGEELAAGGQDVWLIEMVGGPYTDGELCSSTNTCPNYTFADLKGYYWPALIAGVQEYSGKNQVDYVGYDLGCTAALESLESFQNGGNNVGYYFDYNTGQYVYSNLTSSPVDTFVAIACLGNFNDTVSLLFTKFNTNHRAPPVEFFNLSFNSHIKSKLDDHFDALDLKFKSLSILVPRRSAPDLTNLPALSDIPVETLKNVPISVIGILFDYNYEFKGKAISKELFSDIIGFMGSNKPNVGQNVSINKFAIIQSKRSAPLLPLVLPDFSNTDGFVSIEDQKEICKNINSTAKTYLSFKNLNHFKSPLFPRMSDNDAVQDAIKKILDSGQITSDYNEKFELISNSEDCE